MMEKIEDAQGIQRRGNVLAAMAKLKQVCNHPAQLLHDGSAIGRRSGKVVRLEEILAEILAEGDRVLCFTQFTEFGHLLVPHLSARFDTDVAFLHGGTPKKRRDEMVARFQAGEGPPVCCSRSRRAAPGSRSPRPTTWSTSTGGGTRRWRTRPPTGRSASGSGARAGAQVRLPRHGRGDASTR
jgi:hypothetical protein